MITKNWYKPEPLGLGRWIDAVKGAFAIKMTTFPLRWRGTALTRKEADTALSEHFSYLSFKVKKLKKKLPVAVTDRNSQLPKGHCFLLFMNLNKANKSTS